MSCMKEFIATLFCVPKDTTIFKGEWRLYIISDGLLGDPSLLYLVIVRSLAVTNDTSLVTSLG